MVMRMSHFGHEHLTVMSMLYLSRIDLLFLLFLLLLITIPIAMSRMSHFGREHLTVMSFRRGCRILVMPISRSCLGHVYPSRMSHLWS